MPDLALKTSAPPAPDDPVLLRRHLDGDERAFPILIQRHGGLVYGLLGRCGLRPQERDDVFQEVWLRVHRAAHRHDPSRPLRPWLATVALNTARTHLARGRSPEVAREIPERPSPGASPGGLTEGRELADWLRAELDALPEPQRVVVHLSCVVGLAQADVANALDLPVNTVKTHLRRGRLALAHALARRRAIEDREVGR